MHGTLKHTWSVAELCRGGSFQAQLLWRHASKMRMRLQVLRTKAPKPRQEWHATEEKRRT